MVGTRWPPACYRQPKIPLDTTAQTTVTSCYMKRVKIRLDATVKLTRDKASGVRRRLSSEAMKSEG
jgi:hypothetical protein